MAETVKTTVEGGAEKAPRNRAEILTDLIALREKAAKGEVGPDKVIAAHYGAAKELLEAGKDQESFFMLTSTMQLEAAYMGRDTVRYMGEIEEGFGRTGMRLTNIVEEFDKSAHRIGGSVETLQEVGSKINSAANSMETSSSKLDHASNNMQEAGQRISRASDGMQQAAERMHR